MQNTDQSPNTAIILASFGSLDTSAQDSLNNLFLELQNTYPGYEIAQTYTCSYIRKALYKNHGNANAPAGVIDNLVSKGFTKIAILSTHVIPGQEYHELVRSANMAKYMLKTPLDIFVSYPLLGGAKEVARMAQLLMEAYPADIEDEVVMLAGHGTGSAGALAYGALNWELVKKNSIKTKYIVSTLNDIDAVYASIKTLKKGGIKKVKLVPLMTVAGMHTNNDIFGFKKTSIESILKSEGLDVATVKQGLISCPQVITYLKEKLCDGLTEIKQAGDK